MHTFDAQSLTARENYKLLIGSIIPRPIAFVTTLNQDASVNAAPFSFFNIVNKSSANDCYCSSTCRR